MDVAEEDINVDMPSVYVNIEKIDINMEGNDVIFLQKDVYMEQIGEVMGKKGARKSFRLRSFCLLAAEGYAMKARERSYKDYA